MLNNQPSVVAFNSWKSEIGIVLSIFQKGRKSEQKKKRKDLFKAVQLINSAAVI